LRLIEIQYEQPNGRRQVGVLSLGIDLGDESLQSDIARDGNFIEPVPELFLKADARPATGNDHGILIDRTRPSFTVLRITRPVSDHPQGLPQRTDSGLP
jgi:hypothetical protein